MVRNIDGDVVLGGEVGEQLGDLIDQVVIVFRDPMRLDERVEGDEVDLVADNSGLERRDQRAARRTSLSVEEP
jgi:hypothetical protein